MNLVKNKIILVLSLTMVIILSVFITCGIPISLVALSAINTNKLNHTNILETYGNPLVEMHLTNKELSMWVPRAKIYPESDVLMVYSMYGHTLLIASSSNNTPTPGCYRILSITQDGIPSFYFISGAFGIIVGIILAVLAVYTSKCIRDVTSKPPQLTP